MESNTRDEALARRREQNRLAQRRFRWKHSQQKTTTGSQRRGSQTSTRQKNPDPPAQEPTAPSNDFLSPGYFGSSGVPADTGVSSCIFGNLSFLDFTNVDNFLTPASESTLDAAFAIPPALEDMPVPAAIGPEIEMMSDVQPASKEVIQTLTPESMASNALQRSRANSKDLHQITRTNSLTSIGSFAADGGTVQQSERSHSAGPASESSVALSKQNGWLSPLHMAAQKGHDRIVRVLLQHQTDCNERDSDGLTPLQHAVIGGYDDVVTSLVEHGARIGDVDSQQRSALHWAVLQRRESLLKILLQHCGGDRALIDGYDNAGRTPLHTAVDTGFEAGVHTLLQHGADLNCRARKP